MERRPLPRTRPPRAYLTYDFHTGPAIVSVELPFVIGVLADLSSEAQPSPPALKDRQFMPVDRDSFDAVRARFHGRADDASWCSLQDLVYQGEPSPEVKVRVLDATRQELLEDFRAAGSLEASRLFQKVQEEFEVIDGEPYGILLGDYELANTPDDLEFLERMAAVAASAHAPFLSAPSPALFGWMHFSECGLAGRRETEELFESPAYARWRAFRDSPEAAYVCLALPRVRLRPGLWGSAAWTLAAGLAACFRRHGWCAAIREVQSGGPTDAPIDDTKRFSNLGFAALQGPAGTDRAAFFSIPSCRQPAVYVKERADTAARLSATLPYVMAASRFVHYFRSIARDWAPMSREQCETALNSWLGSYVALEDGAAPEARARFPLRDGRVLVIEEEGRRIGEAWLRPVFQVQDLDLPLRVRFELPAPGKPPLVRNRPAPVY